MADNQNLDRESFDVVLPGHVHAPIGMGEHVRSPFRAFREVGVRAHLKDIYALEPRTDPTLVREFGDACVDRLSADFNIFHINGDEVPQVLAHLGRILPETAYNIIYPSWELSAYPQPWVGNLERFDEIWAPSTFIAEAIRPVTERPLITMPLACEVQFPAFIGRRAFGIPDSAYVFFFFFDFTSYLDRKNPFGALEAFRRLCESMPHADMALVLKTNAARAKPDDLARFRAAIPASHGRVRVIDKLMTDSETKNLIRCCDCFLSLHRAEGFGRGLSEAMYLGKPVIATGYSGNMEFMSDDTAYLVDHKLIPVEPGQYPYGEGQVWADPDIDHAVLLMRHLVENPDAGRARGEAASRRIRQQFSYRAAGIRYRERLCTIVDHRLSSTKHDGAPPQNVRENLSAQVG